MRSARHGFGSSASRHLCGPNLVRGGKTEKTNVPVQEIGVGGADRCQRPYGTARGGRRARPPSPPWLLWRPRRLSRLPPRLSSRLPARLRSEEQPSELQSLMRNSYAVFCLKKQKRA